MKRIVLFASGSGTNVENIVGHFKGSPDVTVVAVLANKYTAGVLNRCKRLELPALCFNRSAFYGSDVVCRTLEGLSPDLIVLAGFLWKVPPNVLAAFPNKIINIHPALLPKYGGKGMYGNRVHQAVKDNGDAQTGITVHMVNEHYDEGDILFQARVAVDPTDSVEDIAKKVHRLEYEHYPNVIANMLLR